MHEAAVVTQLTWATTDDTAGQTSYQQYRRPVPVGVQIGSMAEQRHNLTDIQVAGPVKIVCETDLSSRPERHFITDASRLACTAR